MGINATLIVQMITFGLFVWFTLKFIWPPIEKAMRDREARIADGLAAADKGEKALADAEQTRKRELDKARSEAQDILAAANKQASQLVEQARATAQSEAERIRSAAHAETEQEIAKAREALRKQVGDLAVLGAARIVRREIDAARHADVLSEVAEQL